MVYCHIPSEGQGSVRFTAPDELVALLREFDGLKTVDQVVSNAGGPTAEKLRRLIDSFLVPKGVLVDTRGGAPPPRPTHSKSLHLRRTLLRTEVVSRYAVGLAALLRSPVAPIFLTIILATQLTFYAFRPHAFTLDLARVDGWQLTAAILAALFSALCHEFGHAAALLQYGGTRTEIGLGLYLYFPVFYTDVSEAWRFPKWQRVVVDAAGMYFQSIVSTVAIWIFFYTRDSTWAYIVAFVNLSIFGAFNPFFKMDGYWLAADLFGIRNLRDASLGVIAKVIRRPDGRDQNRTQFSRAARLMLPIYTLLSAAFFLYLVIAIGRQVLFLLLPGYPSLLARTMHLYTAFTNTSTLMNGLIEWFWKTSILTGVFIFAWQTAQSLNVYVMRWMRQRSRKTQLWSARTGWFVLAALGAPIAILGHEIAHLLAGSLLEVHGLSLKSQSVSFPHEKEFWKLLGLQQWKAASEILSLWRAGIFAGAGPIFSCVLPMLPALLIQGGRSLGPMAPVLIGAALVSCLRLVAPAAFMILHGLTWALHPPLGLGGGPDEYRFWLVSGIPLFPQVLMEVLICGASILMFFGRMRHTKQSAGVIAAVLGALAGTILLLIYG
jgi:putative peptide zinc metalloprotease protein